MFYNYSINDRHRIINISVNVNNINFSLLAKYGYTDIL